MDGDGISVTNPVSELNNNDEDRPAEGGDGRKTWGDRQSDDFKYGAVEDRTLENARKSISRGLKGMGLGRFKKKVKGADRAGIGQKVKEIHMQAFSLRFDEDEAEHSFRRYMQEQQICRTTIVPVMVLLLFWELERALVYGLDEPWYVYVFEAVLFGIHSFRLGALFIPADARYFDFRTRRWVYMFAGIIALVATLMFSAESEEGAVLLLPNLMLEMLALQWFGLLFQDYCCVMLTTAIGGVVLEVLGGPELQGYGSSLESSRWRHWTFGLHLLILILIFTATARALELQLRSQFVEEEELRKTNTHLKLVVDPFSTSNLRKWMTHSRDSASSKQEATKDSRLSSRNREGEGTDGSGAEKADSDSDSGGRSGFFGVVFSTADKMARGQKSKGIEMKEQGNNKGDDAADKGKNTTAGGQMASDGRGGQPRGGTAKGFWGKKVKTTKTRANPIHRTGWEIDPEDLKMENKLGAGGQGQVWRGWYGEEEVAVKELYSVLLDEDLKAFSRETSILARLHHPNIVRFFGICCSRLSLLIVTEYCQHQLKHMIRADAADKVGKNPKLLQLWRVLQIGKEICEAMCYLIDNNISHGDIKPENVLTDQHYKVKLCDFGMAQAAKNWFGVSKMSLGTSTMTTTKTGGGGGTPMYMSPELIEGSMTETGGIGVSTYQKQDVYSFGVVMWELCVRKEPYVGMGMYEMLLKVVQHQLRPPIPDDMMEPISDIITRCWAHDPKKRPTFQSILESLNTIDVKPPELLDEDALEPAEI